VPIRLTAKAASRPLPESAGYIFKPERRTANRKRANRGGSAMTVGRVACAARVSDLNLLASRMWACLASRCVASDIAMATGGTSSKFPSGLRRQSISSPFAIRRGVVP